MTRGPLSVVAQPPRSGTGTGKARVTKCCLLCASTSAILATESCPDGLSRPVRQEPFIAFGGAFSRPGSPACPSPRPSIPAPQRKHEARLVRPPAVSHTRARPSRAAASKGGWGREAARRGMQNRRQRVGPQRSTEASETGTGCRRGSRRSAARAPRAAPVPPASERVPRSARGRQHGRCRRRAAALRRLSGGRRRTSAWRGSRGGCP